MEWTMPDLGEGVQEGEILKWLVQEGDEFEMDQPILEVMTDKATVELPAPVDGKLLSVKVKEGDLVPIKATLAQFDLGGGSITKKESTLKVEKKKEEVVASQPTASPAPTHHSVLASPSLRKFALEEGINLSSTKGSGPGGRILMEDLKNVSGGQKEQRIPLRGLRRKISEAMRHSKDTAAHFTHVDEADLTTLVTLRNGAKEEAKSRGVKLTFLPFIMKGVACALKKFPNMNASLDESSHEIVLKNHYDIGFAAATQDGLIVPHVKNVDQLSLLEVAAEIERLSNAVREQKAKREELTGSTFTVSNVGSIGGIVSTPIINYPEVAIMGVHKIIKRPVVQNEKIVVRDMTYFSVSADHRVVDGAYVALFLNEVIRVLENPGCMML